MDALLLRRRALMGAEKSRLPDAYQEVQYLESTGTQYIKTNIPLANGDEFETKSSSNSTNTYNTIIGAVAGFELYYNNTKVILWTMSDGIVNITSGQTSNIDLNVTYVHRIEIEKLSRQYYPVNGLEIFAYRDSYMLNGKINYVIWYRDGAVIHSFVPCYRKADNKPGMYDLVTNTFFTNAGTGEFIVGPDVN